jgi:tetratricopeptide (TPR) repeat protein
MGNHTLAINDFNEAIKNDPSNSEGYFRRGLSKYYSKRFKEAISDFEEAQEKELAAGTRDINVDLNAGIYDGMGQCYHALKQYEMAIQKYDAAIDMIPENPQFLQHRAKCYSDQGMHDLAISDLQKGYKPDKEGRSDP